MAGAAGYAATGLGFPSIVKASAPWAELPPSVGDLSKYKVLEIFCPGGMSQWENFWVSHDAATGLNWRGLEEYVTNQFWSACAGTPAMSTATQEFAEDINGTTVSWGPATAPLWRPDIFSRSRMVVTQHVDDIHAFAGYRTLTGRRFGSPRGASLGSAVQRHFQSVAQQEIPYSYVFAPKHLGKAYHLTNFLLLGQHPGPSRPLGLKVGDAVGNLLLRDGVSDTADAIFNELRGQYSDLLRWQGVGDPVRSPDFESFNSAGDYLMSATELDQHLGGEAMVSGLDMGCTNDPSHAHPEPFSNPTQRSLELAAHMLANGARHVGVIDGGLHHDDYKDWLRDSSTPYDAHTRSSKNVVEMTSIHLFNLLQGLASIIQEGSAPSADSILVLPGSSPNTYAGPKIDLDDTLIVINTEFNRRPDPNTGVNEETGYLYAGREHFPGANVAVLIGGPVNQRAIHGGIELIGDDEQSARATTPLTPTDVHAGVLMAAGIDPIDADNFTVGDDFSGEINPGGNAYADEIRMHLKHKVLGVENSVGSTLVGNG